MAQAGFWQMIKDVAVISIVSGGCVGLLWLLGGESGDGLLPYYREVVRHAFSLRELIVYTVKVCAYAMTLEFVVRTIQRRLGEKLPPVLTVVILALVYGLTHLKFSFSGVIYATLLGIVTAVFFQRTGRIWSLVIWHAVWELAAIAFVILGAMFVDGGCRFALLDEYKRSQIRVGSLRYVEGWGWADQQHMEPEVIREWSEKLYKNRGKPVTVELRAGFSRMLAKSKPLGRSLDVTAPIEATEAECHALVCALFWETAVEVEVSQGEQWPITGAPLSSFAYEDLASILLSCYLSQPDEFPLLRWPDVKIEADTKRWETEAVEILSRRTKELHDVDPPDKAVRENLNRLTLKVSRALVR